MKACRVHHFGSPDVIIFEDIPPPVPGRGEPPRFEVVRRLGAQEVIDDSARRYEDVSRSVDAVVDLVGGEMQARSFTVLKSGGILVSTVSQPDQEAADRCDVASAERL
jgi:NADPH:quinone reductase-like Zn-dependent oxidoreductase